MHNANWSCDAVRHGLTPSARTHSRTYSMFLPTATCSYGAEIEATSNTLENA